MSSGDMRPIDSHSVLRIDGYSLDYATPTGFFPALDDVSLTIARGEVVGLVGESGSGKSSLAWAILRHLPETARESGAIHLGNVDLLGTSERDIDAIRGRRIGIVFQDPSTSLNPTLTLGSQLVEVLLRHRGMTQRQAREESELLLARVGIARPKAMMNRYPHEASGGEKQRVVIAQAFACQPECMILDEPTTALDVITARQILELFETLQEETNVATLYISHDLAIVASVADRVAVIHRGRIVETGGASDVFAAPRDPYTQMLFDAVPRPDRRLVAIDAAVDTKALILETEHLTVHHGRRSFVESLLRRSGERVVGNRDVNVTLHAGETLGIVGESGSGKSTLAKALTGLNAFEGRIHFGERTIGGAATMDAAYRRDVQIVFQNPDSSLNPRHRVREILSRPLVLFGERSPSRGAIEVLLDEVRLPAGYAERYPHQLSGGEKQRVAIARAFASRPRIVICDEITSSLDVSVQASIVALLVELQRARGTSYVFITHDLNLVRQIAHRILVMLRGEVVETLDVDSLPDGASHWYTQSLLAAVPTLRPMLTARP